MQVLHEQQIIKSLPLKAIVGHALSFEQFLTHMLHQARAQARLRSLQERKYRTAARAARLSLRCPGRPRLTRWVIHTDDVGTPYTKAAHISGHLP
jgi:hypothetical protein